MSIEPEWLYLIPIAFLAGLLRGYTGFGFAAVAVVGLNLFMVPQQSVPVVLGIDILCGLPLLRQAFRDADFATFKLLVFGALLGIPIGLGLILLVPSEVLKLGICLLILVVCMLLAINIRFRGTDKSFTKFGFGIFSGAATAGSSVGGPVIVCYMLSSSLNSAKQRGTMILFFIISQTIALMSLFGGGLFNFTVVKLILLLILPTLLAVWIGQCLFNRYQPRSFKPIALPIMVAVSLLGIFASIRVLT